MHNLVAEQVLRSDQPLGLGNQSSLCPVKLGPLLFTHGPRLVHPVKVSMTTLGFVHVIETGVIALAHLTLELLESASLPCGKVLLEPLQLGLQFGLLLCGKQCAPTLQAGMPAQQIGQRCAGIGFAYGVIRHLKQLVNKVAARGHIVLNSQLCRAGCAGILFDGFTARLPEYRSSNAGTGLAWHEMILFAVMLVAIPFQIDQAGQQYRNPYMRRSQGAEQHRRTGNGQPPLCIQPGKRYSRNRVVMVYQPVVNQILCAFDKGGVAGTGSAEGVEYNRRRARQSSQPVREQERNGTAETMAADDNGMGTC